MKLRRRDPGKHYRESSPRTHAQPTSNAETPPRRRCRRRHREEARFTCALCRTSYTRRSTVFDHFPSCARKNGNPKGLKWDDDITCWVRGRLFNDKVEATWRSDSLVGEWTAASTENQAMLGDEDMEGDETEVEEGNVAEGVEMRSSPPWRLPPASVFQRVAEWEPEPETGAELESDVVAGVEVDRESQEGTEERWLHPFLMMRIASLVILASKEYASRGLEEAKAVFEHWANLDPHGTRPTAESLEEMTHYAPMRRVAIGRFANRVFSSCLTEAGGRHEELLALTSGLRDVAAELGAADTVAEVHDLVSLAFGDEGPLML